MLGDPSVKKKSSDRATSREWIERLSNAPAQNANDDRKGLSHLDARLETTDGTLQEPDDDYRLKLLSGVTRTSECVKASREARPEDDSKGKYEFSEEKVQ